MTMTKIHRNGFLLIILGLLLLLSAKDLMAATNTVDAQSGEWTTFNGAPVFHLQGTVSSTPTHWRFTTASGIVGIELRIVAFNISCGMGVGSNCVWDAYLDFTDVPPGTYKILVKAFFSGGTAQDIYPDPNGVPTCYENGTCIG